MLLSRRLFSFHNKKKLQLYPIFIQKRTLSYPVLILSGIFNLYSFLQLRNPYYPRNKIPFLLKSSYLLFLTGLII